MNLNLNHEIEDKNIFADIYPHNIDSSITRGTLKSRSVAKDIFGSLSIVVGVVANKQYKHP